MTDAEILDYIAAHDTSSVTDIIVATGVERSKLYRLLRRHHKVQAWVTRTPVPLDEVGDVHVPKGTESVLLPQRRAFLVEEGDE